VVSWFYKAWYFVYRVVQICLFPSMYNLWLLCIVHHADKIERVWCALTKSPQISLIFGTITIVRKYFVIVKIVQNWYYVIMWFAALRLQCLVFPSSVSASFSKLFSGFLHVYTILKLLYIIVRNSAINSMYKIWRCKLVHLTVKALCAFWIF